MLCFLSGNTLKIIAAISMLIDHIGYMFFPDILIFRIIGRLAFPIFAYMIAEGCRYTKNKLRYFTTIFILALLCQCAYFYSVGDMYLNVLVTFSLSIALIFSFQQCLKALRQGLYVNALLFPLSVLLVYIFTLYFKIDYGFHGIMLPLFASIISPKDEYSRKVNVALFTVGLFILSLSLGGVQYYSLLASGLLLMYSGKRGKYKMKYFFYVFYPLHLISLEIIKICF